MTIFNQISRDQPTSTIAAKLAAAPADRMVILDCVDSTLKHTPISGGGGGGLSIASVYPLSMYAGDLAAALTDIAVAGGSGLLLVDMGATLVGHTTIPATVSIQFLSGCIIDLDNFNLIINGQISAGVYQIFDYTGTGRITFGPTNTEVLPEWWGAVGDGVVDDADAVRYATNATGKQGATWVTFTRITYLISTPIFASGDGIDHLCWRGVRQEKGTNNNSGNRTRTIIKFGSANPAEWLLLLDGDSASPVTAAPIILQDLTFLALSGGSLLKLAQDNTTPGFTSPPVGNKIENCIFQGVSQLAANYEDLVVTRSTQVMVHIEGCFETLVNRCSIYAGGIGLYIKDCDDNFYNDLRIQGQFVCVYLDHHTGSAGGHQVFDGLEMEGTFGVHIVHLGGSLTVRNGHLERGTTLFRNMTTADGITCTTTAHSNVFVFTQDMTNILFPDISAIRLTFANGVQECFIVSAVAGTDVTVYANNAAADDTYLMGVYYSEAGVTVDRLHGLNLLDHCDDRDVRFDSFSFGIRHVEVGYPPAVILPCRNEVTFVACGQPVRPAGPFAVCANRQRTGTFFEVPRINFIGCTDNMSPPGANPFVFTDGLQDAIGRIDTHLDGQSRHPQLRDPLEDILLTRKWFFNTKNMGRLSGGITSTRNHIISVPGESNTSQQHYAFEGNSFDARDYTLPYESCYLKFKVLASVPVAIGTETLLVYANIDDITVNTLIASMTIDTEMKVREFIIRNPFNTTPRSVCNVRFTFDNASVGYFGGFCVEQTSMPILSGAGSPENVVAAPVGTLFMRSDGGVGTSMYVKESGVGNIGWAAK
jgi:hypothetical protein